MFKDFIHFNFLVIELYLVGLRHIFFLDKTVEGGLLECRNRRKKKVVDNKKNLLAVKEYLNGIIDKE